MSGKKMEKNLLDKKHFRKKKVLKDENKLKFYFVSCLSAGQIAT